MNGHGRGGLLAVLVGRPIGVTMFVIGVAVFGMVSLGQLPLDLLPEPVTSGYSSDKLGTDLVDGDHATNIEFIMGTYDERRFVISMK